MSATLDTGNDPGTAPPEDSVQALLSSILDTLRELLTLVRISIGE